MGGLSHLQRPLCDLVPQAGNVGWRRETVRLGMQHRDTAYVSPGSSNEAIREQRMDGGWVMHGCLGSAAALTFLPTPLLLEQLMQ